MPVVTVQVTREGTTPGQKATLIKGAADVPERPVAELTEQVRAAEAANTDGTGWREARLKA